MSADPEGIRERDPSLAIQERYTGDSGRAYHQSRFAIPETAYPWVARQRARKIAPQVHSEDAVVEFGVGHGWNLAALACRERIGFDVGAHVEPILRQHGIAFVDRPEQLRSESADVLICHHVLEHVADPAGTLAEFRRILAPQGRLLLFVPYEIERRFRRYRTDEPNHHLFSWTTQSLGNLVTDSGFAVASARVGEFGYDRIAAVWSHRLHLGELGFRALRRAAHTLRPGREVRIVATRQGR